MSLSSLPAFGPTCPLGGTWYACGTGTFFTGCCTRNPCQITCAQGDLYPAGFNPSYHGNFPDASCGSGVSFYTCTAGNTFMGCCKTNPCTSGSVCSSGFLEPAFVNRDDLRAAYGAVGGSSSTSSTRPTSASTISTSRTSAFSTIVSSTTNTATATATATRDVAVATSAPKNGPPVAAIAGGAAGGAFALAAAVGLLIYYFCHAKKSREGHEESVVRPHSDIPPMMASKNKPLPSPGPPPGYTSPDPNNYYPPHTGQYQGYNHPQQHQYALQPQELSIEPHSPAPFSHKPIPTHQRNLSELSGDTATRSELETPYGAPPGQSHFATPISSPQSGMHPDWQSPTSAHYGQNWTPHKSWQTQRELGRPYELSQGLGLQGDMGHNANVSGQQSYGDDRRHYHA